MPQQSVSRRWQMLVLGLVLLATIGCGRRQPIPEANAWQDLTQVSYRLQGLQLQVGGQQWAGKGTAEVPLVRWHAAPSGGLTAFGPRSASRWAGRMADWQGVQPVSLSGLTEAPIPGLLAVFALPDTSILSGAEQAHDMHLDAEALRQAIQASGRAVAGGNVTYRLALNDQPAFSASWMLFLQSKPTLPPVTGRYAQVSALAGGGLSAEQVKNLQDPRLAVSSDAVLGVIYRLGSMIGAVQEGGPAQKAGIEPGDILLAVNHAPVCDMLTSLGALQGCRAGDDVPVLLWRDDKVVSLVVRLAAR